MEESYNKYKTNVQISRKIHKLLKNLKEDNETFNDILTRILKKGGYL